MTKLLTTSDKTLKVRKAVLDDVPEIFHNSKEVWEESVTKISLKKLTTVLCSAVDLGYSYVFEDENNKITGCLIVSETDFWWTKETYDTNVYFWIKKDYRTLKNLKQAFEIMKGLYWKTGRKFYYETFAYNRTTGNVSRGRFI